MKEDVDVPVKVKVQSMRRSRRRSIRRRRHKRKHRNIRIVRSNIIIMSIRTSIHIRISIKY